MSGSNEIFRDIVQSHLSRLSPTDRRVADYLLRFYPRFLFQTASEIAHELGTSVSAVTRFFPKIGFKNIREAYSTLREQTDFVAESPLSRYHERHLPRTGEDILLGATLGADLANLRNTFALLEDATVQSFVELVTDPKRRIHILGSRKVFAPAYYLFIQLTAVRNRVSLVRTDNSLVVETALEADENDVLIVFDFRRYPKVHMQTAQIFKERGAAIIGFIDSPLAPMVPLADTVFKVETLSASAFDSYTAAIGLINALIAEVVEHYGEDARKRYERMEQVYTCFDVWSRQTPIDRNFPKKEK